VLAQINRSAPRFFGPCSHAIVPSPDPLKLRLGLRPSYLRKTRTPRPMRSASDGAGIKGVRPLAQGPPPASDR